MKLLVLGGTRFSGRAFVEAAIARGHEVTVFHRGQSGAAPAGAASVTGDRTESLAPLDGQAFDAVVDMCGFVPRHVRAAAERFAGAHYAFVSSISAYADASTAGQDEDAPLAVLDDPAVEEITGATYGGLKALCESAVREVHGDGALIARPGLIVGPNDYTDRFPYWPRRIAAGGEVLAPGSPDAPVQFIDARDLAGWLLRMVEARASGTFNATGPATPLTLGAFLDACRRVTASDATFTWVDEEFLLARGVAPFSELPLWVPAESRGFLQTDCRRAIGAGLAFRPVEDTIRDTRAWDAERTDADRRATAGSLAGASLRPERERELLAAWHARGG